MLISIWIIILIVVSILIFFYYKKNKHKLVKPIKPDQNIKAKYALTNIDKMLENVTNKPDNNKLSTPEDLSENENKEKEIQSDGNTEKQYNAKESIIGSIILERRKKK